MKTMLVLLRRWGAAFGGCLAALLSPGLAQAFNEAEPNDTLATAQAFANTPGNMFIDGSRTFANTSDDFFSFLVRGAGQLRIVATSTDATADSIMGLFNAAGVLVASNDDAGGGPMSIIDYTVPAGQLGRFSIGFSGYNPGLLSCAGSITQCYDTNGDFVFDTFVAGGGAGGSAGWDYRLTLSGVALVPEPRTALLFAPAALALLLWRRRTDARRQAAAAASG